MPSTEQLLYQTDRNIHLRCSVEKAIPKNTCVGVSSSTLLKRDSKTGVLHMRTAASEMTLESDCLELCFWTVPFKTILTR